MGIVTEIGGPKMPDLEQRRQTLIDTRLARMGELAAARAAVTDLEQQVFRLEGGIIELGRLIERPEETT